VPVSRGIGRHLGSYAFSPPTGDRRGRLAKLAVTRYTRAYNCATDTLTLPLAELLGTSRSGSYAATDPEECFATAADTEAAGYRAPRK